MRKTLIVIILTFVSTVCFAKSKSVEPDWFKNYRTVFPNAQYLAQRGSGTTAEEAKTDAASQLARYFQSTVSANLSTTMSSITTGSSIHEETRVIDEVNVTSEVEFIGLEFTESYFYEAEKKWYAVAFIVREDAWIQYKPKIEAEKTKPNADAAASNAEVAKAAVEAKKLDAQEAQTKAAAQEAMDLADFLM